MNRDGDERTFRVDARRPVPVAERERASSLAAMAMEPEELENVPPQGTSASSTSARSRRTGRSTGSSATRKAIDEFAQRAQARLQLLPPHDPQFRRNRERVARDAEREHLILEWDLGYDEGE